MLPKEESKQIFPKNLAGRLKTALGDLERRRGSLVESRTDANKELISYS